MSIEVARPRRQNGAGRRDRKVALDYFRPRLIQAREDSGFALGATLKYCAGRMHEVLFEQFVSSSASAPAFRLSQEMRFHETLG
jgi:hypothetical protein